MTVQQSLSQLQTDVGQLQTDLNNLKLRRATDPMQGIVTSLHTDMTAVSADLAALTAAIGAQPPPIPSPPPAPTPVPIAPIFIAPGAGSWTDKSGAIWSIDGSANILMNGDAAAAKNWQSHLGAGFNGTFYILGLDMNVYAWQNPWQLIPYVAATNPVPPPPGPPPPPPPGNLVAFYVNPITGNDANTGTRNSPFLTLEKAQSAMQGSKTKTTVLMAGVFNRTGTFTLAAADAGTTWRFDPATGTNADYNQAILDGGNTVGDLIDCNSANVIIDGIQFRNCTNSAVTCIGPNHNGTGFNTTNNIIRNCIAHDISNVNGGPLASWDAQNIKILNNLVYNVQSKGIAAEATNAGDNYSGADIENNIIFNSNTNTSDNGAIYLQDLGGQGSNNITIKNNFIRDYGTVANFNKGIYFDDGASNATVTQNVISGLGQFAFQYHGGDNNVVNNNLIDLGSVGNQWILFYQLSGPATTINNMNGNTFTDNIIISSTNTPNSFDTNISGQTLPTVTLNDYFAYNGGGTNHSQSGITDANPQASDPQLSGWAYTIAAGSAVLGAPMNFTPPAGGWGPPGTVINANGTITTANGITIGPGTAPSSPH